MPMPRKPGHFLMVTRLNGKQLRILYGGTRTLAPMPSIRFLGDEET